MEALDEMMESQMSHLQDVFAPGDGTEAGGTCQKLLRTALLAHKTRNAALEEYPCPILEYAKTHTHTPKLVGATAQAATLSY